MPERVRLDLLGLVQKVADFTVEAIYEVDEYIGDLRGAINDKDYTGLTKVADQLDRIDERVKEVYNEVSQRAVSEMETRYGKPPLGSELEKYYSMKKGIFSDLAYYCKRIIEYARDGDWDKADATLDVEMQGTISRLWDLHDELVIDFYSIGAGYVIKG